VRRQPVVKFLEIRDRATFIPAVAVSCELSGNEYDDYLLRRAGYGSFQRCVLLTRLDGGWPAHYDPHDWGDRTWQVAHAYITEHWDEITDSEVIDVQVILGEATEPKVSERHDRVDI
jgi:hypothetical protein